MRRLSLLVGSIAFLVGSLQAAEIAPGLVYLRPGMNITSEPGSAVLDFRYVTDVAEASPLIAAVSSGNANDRRVILALVSPETPPGLRRQIAALPRCLTVGYSAPEFKTDIVVNTSPEADRHAFEALVAGTPAEKLLVDKAKKPRYDETALIREHNGEAEPATKADSVPATRPEDPEASPQPASPAQTPHTPVASTAPAPAASAEIDAVLQRAVQVHRGLLVLKKL